MKISTKRTRRWASGVLWTALVCGVGWAHAHQPERPVADGGQPLRTDRPGVVFSTTGEAEQVRVGATLFGDRRHQLKQWPSELALAIYLHDTIGGEKSLRVIRPGMVYFLTPLPHRNPRGSQADRLQRQGFTRVAVPEVELFQFAQATETYCALFQKECAAREVVEFGLWAVPVMLAEARTTAQDAQPTPGRETVMVAGREHPVPLVDTNPGPEYADANRRFGIASSIARTPGGRLWCGFSSGGEMESQDNFGVVVYSDDDGRTWSQPCVILDQDGPGGIAVAPTPSVHRATMARSMCPTKDSAGCSRRSCSPGSRKRTSWQASPCRTVTP